MLVTLNSISRANKLISNKCPGSPYNVRSSTYSSIEKLIALMLKHIRVKVGCVKSGSLLVYCKTRLLHSG
jgi:hypothetical protein